MVEKSETDAAARVAAGDATATASLSTLFANANQAADLKTMVEKSEIDAAAQLVAAVNRHLAGIERGKGFIFAALFLSHAKIKKNNNLIKH